MQRGGVPIMEQVGVLDTLLSILWRGNTVQETNLQGSWELRGRGAAGQSMQGAQLCDLDRVGCVVGLLHLLRPGAAGAGPALRQHCPLPGHLPGGGQGGRGLQQWSLFCLVYLGRLDGLLCYLRAGRPAAGAVLLH